MEMIKAPDNMIRNLAAAIFHDCIRFQLTRSKVSLSAFTRASVGNYRGLKLTEQAMKILEDRMCLLMTPILALSQEEALQMLSLWSGSCRRNT